MWPRTLGNLKECRIGGGGVDNPLNLDIGILPTFNLQEGSVMPNDPQFPRMAFQEGLGDFNGKEEGQSLVPVLLSEGATPTNLPTEG